MDTNKIQAVIFDMDGVISDTQKLHAEVESNLLAKYGIHISPEEITKRYAGVKTSEFIDALLSEQETLYSMQDLMKEKWAEMERLASESVDQIEGSVELIKALHAQGFKLAVASASNFNYVENVIKRLGLESYFEALISGDMVANGKPDPEIFLLAASKIQADPNICVVIEDGVSGMEAAGRANMRCIGLVSSKDREYPTKNLVFSLNEVNSDYLDNL